MISIRKYLENGAGVGDPEAPARKTREGGDRLRLSMAAWRSALVEMGRSSVDASPATGPELEKELAAIVENLDNGVTEARIASADKSVQAGLQEWGRRTARHYQQKATEVKEILLAMARLSESAAQRDCRCVEQINEVTANLKNIASLEDLTHIRTSIEKSAAELKDSIDRITAEGKAAFEQMQAQVKTFQSKLEEAEELAWRDSLTRLRSRLCVELQIERRIAMRTPFCIAILDLDGFKAVNDAYGHVVGDDVLRQFAGELQAACSSTDVVGRWGGDEFIVVLDSNMQQAESQMDRVSRWVCGNYTVEDTCCPAKLHVNASVGIAEYRPREAMKDLLCRADSAMYARKAAVRQDAGVSKRANAAGVDRAADPI